MSIESSAFDFDLPMERIAQRPRPHDEQRLLVFRLDSGQIEHRRYLELPAILRAGDVLVLNDSRVVPAQLRAADGTVLVALDPTSQSLRGITVISSRPLARNERLQLPCASFIATSEGRDANLFVGDLLPEDHHLTVFDYLERFGEPPLPPYLGRRPDASDTISYQTEFAREPGSIAAPTAGLHFHSGLIEALRASGIEIHRITLHVGYGTFRRLETRFVDEHRMDAEHFRIEPEVAKALWTARKERRRIVAVGMTSTRTLETVADALNSSEPPRGELSGWTRMFIYRPYQFRTIDGLITNFHYPRTSVMSLTAAFCGGVEQLRDIYGAALARDYLFFSYGDGMLAL